LDIFSMYTKEQNMKAGRTGFSGWKSEKIDIIRPADYGCYLLIKRKGGWLYGLSKNLC